MSKPEDVTSNNSGKIAIYHQQAEELYVHQGLTLEIIEKVLNEAVTARTLRNWRKNFKWDDKRKKYLSSTKNLIESWRQIAIDSSNVARQTMNQKDIKAAKEAIKTLEALEKMKSFDPEDKFGKKPAGESTAKTLRKLLNI